MKTQPTDTENFFRYLPICDQNIQWGLYLTGAGCCRVAPHSPYPPGGHPDVYGFRWETGRVLPEYQILLIAEGSGTFESAKSDTLCVRQGDVMLLFPDLWHRYRPDPATGWKEYWLSWNGEILYRMLRHGLLDPCRPVLTVQNPGDILAAFERIIAHVLAYPADNPNVLSAYAMEVLTLAMQHRRTPAVTRDVALPVKYAHSLDDPILFKAVQIIWNHSYRDFRVDDVVRQLPVTRRTLERKFRKKMACSIHDEITRCRTERAKHLLANTDLPLRHIALSVGFPSQDSMLSAFNETLKVTPKAYRMRQRAQIPTASLDHSARG